MTRIIVSTDIGSDVDDALCLLASFNLGLEIEAIYVTNGDVTARALIAAHMVKLAGKKSSVGLGEAESLVRSVRPYNLYAECLVDETYIDWDASENSPIIIYRPLKDIGIIENGVADMANRLAKDEFIIFSLAPLTNIARLIVDFPEVIKNIQCLYVMGGRFFSDTRLEHNIHHDPEAATIVFDSDIFITVVPGDICSQYYMPKEMLAHCESKVGLYVKRMADSYAAAITATKYVSLISNSTAKELLDVRGISNRRVAASRDSKDKFHHQLYYLQGVMEDIDGAAFDPDCYMEAYNLVINELAADKTRGITRVMADHLLSLIHREFSVADVYIPYCFKYPERTKTIKGTVKFSAPFGESYLCEGIKHTIISEIEIAHFERFLKEYIH